MMDLVVEILGIKNAMFAWAFEWYDIVVATIDLGVTGFGDLYSQKLIVMTDDGSNSNYGSVTWTP